MTSITIANHSELLSTPGLAQTVSYATLCRSGKASFGDSPCSLLRHLLSVACAQLTNQVPNLETESEFHMRVSFHPA